LQGRYLPVAGEASSLLFDDNHILIFSCFHCTSPPVP
jgi:hypothetical protein